MRVFEDDLVRQDDRRLLEERSLAAVTYNDEPSKTVQGPAAEADMNAIAKMFGLSPFGKIPALPPEAVDPRYYGDLNGIDMDLQTALNRVQEAVDHFEALPATVRSRFDHNPGKLYEFVHDERNREEAISLGILVAPPAPPAAPASTPPVEGA